MTTTDALPAPRSGRAGPSGPSDQVGRLARHGALNLAGSLAGGLAGITLVLVTTNGFAQPVAGRLFAATALFLIVSALTELGTDAGLAHTVQRELVAGRPDRARGALVVALVPVLTLGALLACAGWVAAPWLSDSVTGNDGMTGMLRVLATMLPLAVTYDILLATTRAYGTMRANVLVEKLGRLPLQILAVGGVALLGAGPVWLALAWALPYLPGLVAVTRWCARLGKGARIALDRELVQGFWTFTAPRALGRVCQVGLQRADIVLVAAMLGPESAAIYTAATKVLSVGQLGTQSVQQVLQPQLSALFATGDLAGARAVFRIATAWLMALAWPVYLVGAVAAGFVLQLFGDGYAAGRDALVILTLAMLVATACGPVDTALLMAGRSRQSLGNSALALVIDLALIAVLVPVFGLTGAALAWGAALVVRNLLPVVQVRRAYGLRAFGAASAWVAGSAVICFGVLPLVGTLWLGLELPVLLVCLVLGGLAYAGLVWRGSHLLAISAFAPMAGRVRGAPRTLPRTLRRAGTRLATRLGRRLGRLPLPHRARVALSRVFLRRLRPVEVPLGRLLLGPQDGVPVQRYAHAYDDLLWGSTPVAEGPHTELLHLADAGELTDSAILGSSYAEHARRCLQLTERYFWATDEAGIVEVARAFVARNAGEVAAGRQAQSGPGDPILVAPIRDSDCFSVLDGHHRLAQAAHSGRATVPVVVKRTSVSTPLQDLLDRMSWIGGRQELYQPIDAPELRRGWTTVRRCTDRLEKIDLFLTSRGSARTEYRQPSYLDVASCYGWFVARMGTRGFEAEGVERDPLARQLGAAAYGLDPSRIHVGDAAEFLRTAVAAGRRFDVVSCFSLLHHFVLGRGDGTSAEELVRLLGQVTRDVLFLDTGQEHEAWFASSLAGWDAERVRAFLLEHGDFAEVIDLGPDSDAVPPYDGNYGRTLFGCVRASRHARVRRDVEGRLRTPPACEAGLENQRPTPLMGCTER